LLAVGSSTLEVPSVSSAAASAACFDPVFEVFFLSVGAAFALLHDMMQSNNIYLLHNSIINRQKGQPRAKKGN
jgi:hypothetical protein